MNKRFHKQLFLTLLVCGAVISLMILLPVLKSISIENNNNLRDSTQIFLMSKSLIGDHTPYEHISKLREKYLHVEDPYQNHPSPYPLLLPILVIPLTFLDLTTFTFVWIFFYVTLLFLSVHEIFKLFWTSRPNALLSLGATLILIPSYPISSGLQFGQVDPLLLMLFVLALKNIHRKKNFPASIYLTLITCIKTIGAPFILSAISVKKFRFGALLALGATTTATLYHIGYDGLITYLTNVTKSVVHYYVFFPQNLSFVSFFCKTLYGFNLVQVEARMLPLESQPIIHQSLLQIASLIPFLFALVLCLISRKKDHLIIILFPLCIFCSPILWSFYFILFLPLFIREILFCNSRLWRCCALIVFIILFYIDTNTLAYSLSNHTPLIPFVPSISAIIASMSPVFILLTYSLSVLVRDIKTPFKMLSAPLFIES